MLEQALELAGDVLVVLAGVGAMTFAASYATFFNWRKTAPGRALMYFVLSLIALVGRSFFGRWFGADNWWWQPLTVVVLGAVAATIWLLVIVLWRNYRRGDDRPLAIETRSRNDRFPEKKEQDR